MCHSTSLHPAAVKAVLEPGESQKADGLTKVACWCINENIHSLIVIVFCLASHHFGGGACQ